MNRLPIRPRPDWPAKVEALGFNYHTAGGVPYWNEAAAYVFTSREIDVIEAATNRLQELVVQAVEHIIAEDRFAELHLGPRARELILSSWHNPRFDERSIFGRFDLAYNGRGEPKLLEYNADTPTSLPEAAVVQWYWLQEVFPSHDQFNSIHERLLARWAALAPRGPVHFTALRESEEDYGNVRYMADCAKQAGVKVADFLYVEDIGWNGRHFTDLQEREIRNLFKLYPWEWMIRDQFGIHLEEMRVIEPAWKMLLSNKALLPILWELAPNHPNLLWASNQPPRSGSYVSKPVLSREGGNIAIYENGQKTLETGGGYGAEPVIYQEYFPAPEFDGHRPMLGSWIIGEEAAGLGVREDDSPVTGNFSRFVPHYFQ